MKEVDVIKQTATPLTKEDLTVAFKQMGITTDDVILVHSSLSRLGFVIGGAQTVVESLCETVSSGTLVMPTHSGDLSDPKYWENPPVPKEWFESLYEAMPAFSKALTPTRGMGKIVDTFLRKSGSYRSNHPQVSFTAYGKEAKLITENHHLTPSLGINSPLGKLYTLPSKIVLLGVSFESCTAFHLSEVLTKTVAMKETGAPIMKDGIRQWVTFEDYDYDSEHFLQYGEVLLKEGMAKRYPLGIGEVTILPFKASVDRVSELMLKRQSN